MADPLTSAQAAAAKARADAATNMPWLAVSGPVTGEDWLIGLGSSRDGQDYHVTTDRVRASEYDGDAKSDAAFIAAARTDVPALVATVLHKTAALDLIREVLQPPVDQLDIDNALRWIDNALAGWNGDGDGGAGG